MPPDPQLLGPGICNAVVCVTGAGGSIGSKLSRQILALSPARLILMERNESALYAIEQELRSLVPLFRRQIAAGGPITLTHLEIIRYFMTIPEEATLVLQSSVLAQGGDVFLLDMGEPVRIKALAEQMVRLSGLSLRDAAHPDGDIAIVCTGLRPGEKLYEELLIEAESQPTAHPLIYRAQERWVPPHELWPQLAALD